MIYGRTGDIASLLPIQRRLTALNRDEPGELRDLGILCVKPNVWAKGLNRSKRISSFRLEPTTPVRSGICWELFAGRFRDGIELIGPRSGSIWSRSSSVGNRIPERSRVGR